MAASDARPVPIKNTAFRAYFPILDADGDPVSAAAALDSEVSIDGAAFADATNEATEIGTSGIYSLDLTAGEMNGDGIVVQVKTSTAGAKTTVLTFYPEEAGDINVDVTAFGGTAGTFAAGRPEVNTTHAAGTAWGSGAITAASIAADAITAAKIADAAIDAATFAAGAIDAAAIAADAIGAAEIANGAIDAATFAAGAIDAAAIAANAIGASELAADAVAELADGVWDEATSGHTTAGSYGDKFGSHLPAILKVIVGAGSTTTAVVLNATTGIDGGAPSATNDFYNGRVLVFTSGALAGQATDVTDYVGATVTLTVTALTGAPAADVTAVIV